MVSPELVTAVVSTLAAYLAPVGESFVKELGKAAHEKAGELYRVVKDRFKKEKIEENMAKKFKKFKKDPQGNMDSMKEDLEKIMSSDSDFLNLVQKLLKELKEISDKAGTTNKFNTMVTGGKVEKIVNIDNINGKVEF